VNLEKVILASGATLSLGRKGVFFRDLRKKRPFIGGRGRFAQKHARMSFLQRHRDRKRGGAYPARINSSKGKKAFSLHKKKKGCRPRPKRNSLRDARNFRERGGPLLCRKGEDYKKEKIAQPRKGRKEEGRKKKILKFDAGENSLPLSNCPKVDNFLLAQAPRRKSRVLAAEKGGMYGREPPCRRERSAVPNARSSRKFKDVAKKKSMLCGKKDSSAPYRSPSSSRKERTTWENSCGKKKCFLLCWLRRENHGRLFCNKERGG